MLPICWAWHYHKEIVIMEVILDKSIGKFWICALRKISSHKFQKEKNNKKILWRLHVCFWNKHILPYFSTFLAHFTIFKYFLKRFATAMWKNFKCSNNTPSNVINLILDQQVECWAGQVSARSLWGFTAHGACVKAWIAPYRSLQSSDLPIRVFYRIVKKKLGGGRGSGALWQL